MSATIRQRGGLGEVITAFLTEQRYRANVDSTVDVYPCTTVYTVPTPLSPGFAERPDPDSPVTVHRTPAVPLLIQLISRR